MTDTINILLVDDEARNLDALESILDDPGYRLLRAGGADQALHLLLEHDVAAIVLDIKMPGVSGFELAELIKGTKKFRQIPIVFLTAYLVDDADVVTGYGTGAVDYLTKPVNPLILRHKVAVFADLFRKTRALAELNDTLETRVQQRTMELEKSEATLRHADKQKDVFLATLAHELRNPLAPLRTGLDLLLHEADKPPSRQRTLAAMNRQLDYMVRLIDDLLDVSRISRGTLEMRKERTELGATAQRAIELAAPAFARRDQSVLLDTRGDVAAVVDPTRIAQIVANLLNNASKHSPDGAKVQVRLRRTGDRAVVEVIDEGVGIPADQLEKVFDMFAKIERPGGSRQDGLGIGLGLSRHLAQLHGGTLTAASAGDGKGATFTLSLPTGIGEHVDGARDAEARPDGAPNASASTRLAIVVIEDNEDSADMLSTWLEMLGHDVKLARTGPDGLALVLQSRPDVVLCDIGLPGIDGAEVCQRVVESMTAPPTMVALTGWGMQGDRARTQKAGFHHHLVKPVELDKLRELLESVTPPAGTASSSSRSHTTAT